MVDPVAVEGPEQAAVLSCHPGAIVLRCPGVLQELLERVMLGGDGPNLDVSSVPSPCNFNVVLVSGRDYFFRHLALPFAHRGHPVRV